jgi:hypothetical protein
VSFLVIKPGGTGIPASPGQTGGQTGKSVLLPAFDACSLINSSEIAAVQGTPVQLSQPTGYAYGNLKISQCYYTAISGDGKNPNNAPDNNFSGYDFWLNKMNQFSVAGEHVRDANVALARVKRAEMVKGIHRLW